MRTIIALLIATSGMTALAGQSFMAIDDRSSLRAISNNGQAVGSVDHGDGTQSAILFDGSVHTVGTGTYAYATDINDQGGILYYVQQYDSSYYYDQSTGTSTITRGHGYEGCDHYATKLNNNGLMIGYHHQYAQIRDTWGFTCSLSNITPVVLPNHQMYVDPGPITGSWANGLNDAGVVVGSCGWWPGDANQYQRVACYWTGTTIHKMDTLGYSSSIAWAINTQGDIAGALYNTGITRGFLYSGGTMHELSNFTEAPVAMNDSGVILGAKTFYRNGVVENLVDLMPAGWSNINATDINNSNQVCGYATGPDGLTHGFILTVPEPATLSLLALGGVTLLRRRK